MGTTAARQYRYLRITPTDAPLEPGSRETGLARLHALGPTEWLLVATDGRLRYYVGTPAEDRARLERLLRGLVPEGYELTPGDPELDGLCPAEPDADREATVDAETAALTLHGRGERPADWQTRLDVAGEEPGLAPLSHVAETFAGHEGRAVYQALLTPKPDWTHEADWRRDRLERHVDTPGQRLVDALVGPTTAAPDETDEHDLDPRHRERLEHLETKDARRSFTVHARAVAHGPDTAATLETLAPAFAAHSGPFYAVDPVVETDRERAMATLERVHTRTPEPDPVRRRLGRRLPLTANSEPKLVTDPTTTPLFCLLDGATLTVDGRRALDATPGERESVPRPTEDALARYHTRGLTLGRPRTQDAEADPEPVSLPPSLQPLHVAWFGRTGAGKSTALVNAMLENHAATDGADILVDPKGDGLPEAYLRAHYAEYGTLENVLYFDCAEVLPALSFFDIRPELEAGIDRTTAVADVVDHYIEILVGVMGHERFHQAVRSPDIIRYLVKALFDPVHGHDAYTHRELQQEARRLHATRDPPPVADEDLQAMLGGVADNSERSFHELMQGVANRIEKIPVNDRLGRVFNHVPDRPSGESHETGGETEGDRRADDVPSDPRFELREFLDEDVVIVVDTGGLRPASRRALTLVLLSTLWGALRQRAREDGEQAEDENADKTGNAPLVNLYLEEAAEFARSDLLSNLLSRGRGFGLSITLAMQFPAQLREQSPRAYQEVLNNVGTVVTGNVAVDSALTDRLATDDQPPSEVGNRLRALSRGEWFTRLPAGFDEAPPRPFVLESLPLPPGHPDGEGLGRTDRVLFDAVFARTTERTRLEHGLTLEATPSTVDEQADEAAASDGDDPSTRVDTALPYTKRLPRTVAYDAETHALRCVRCDSRYDPSHEGMVRAITCCGSLGDVDREDVPICDLNLKLTAAECEASEWSLRQLCFLQAVHNAQQLRYQPLEYDLLNDSMLRLQEYVGIDAAAIDPLVEANLLRHDGDHPHRLYSVTADGRAAIGESFREGVDYGHGKGDLDESSLHVMAVEVGRQYLEQQYVTDPDSPVQTVVPYYEVDDYRLDCAGLDADGEVVVAIEAERVNHDVIRAVPDDFDKMAACDPEEAIWIVMSGAAGHEVLAALNDPPDGPVRVEKTYAKSTPPHQFRIDTPGLTAMYPVDYLRGKLKSGS
jgi:DNA helicase HerA-like ATPase